MTTSNENNHSENFEKDRQNFKEQSLHLHKKDQEYIQLLLKPISKEEPVGKMPKSIKSSTDHDITNAMKNEDWTAAKKLIDNTLINEQKGLKYALWLTQCLIELKSFYGFFLGLYIFNDLFENFWEDFYPKEEKTKRKLFSRHFNYINNKLINRIKMCYITDKDATKKLSIYDYEDSRSMKYQKELMNKYDEIIDEEGYENRQEKIKNGKISPEEFDEAMNTTSLNFYKQIKLHISLCIKQIERMDLLIDKYYSDSLSTPGMLDIKENLEFLQNTILKFIHSKKPDKTENDESEKKENNVKSNINMGNNHDDPFLKIVNKKNIENSKIVNKDWMPDHLRTGRKEWYDNESDSMMNNIINAMADPFVIEQKLWSEIKADAVHKLEINGLQYILKELLNRSEYSPSLRIKKRFHLLMAQLCIMDKRTDLAEPIASKLNELIESDQERISHWEASAWTAEVYETFYQCLSDNDESLKKELKLKICKTDVTRLMTT